MYAPEAESMSRERGENCSAICDRRECVYANLNFGATVRSARPSLFALSLFLADVLAA
jgi:hypothetical protein